MSERAPRVLVSGLVLGQPMGGVRRHNQELLPRAARLLAAGGGGLCVLEGREPVAFPLPAPVELRHSRVPMHPVWRRALGERRALLAELRRAHADARPFDLVHSAHLPSPARLPLPRSHAIHDLRALELAGARRVRRRLAERAIAAALEGARAVVTVSETMRAELLARFAIAPERAFVVPNGADHLPLEPRAAGGERPILFVGHLEPRKNVALLVRALAADRSLPPLEVVGAAKGAGADELRALAGELGVGSRLRLLGALSDPELARAYARAGCFCLPSRLEGFGIPILEAMRAGVPVAVARTDAMLEVAGGEAETFATDDPAECAAALRRTLDAGADRIERARARAARYEWQASAEALVGAWASAAR